MKRSRLLRTWTWLKKIFFWIFLVHITWFLFFIWKTLSVPGFPVPNPRIKMLMVCGGLVILGLVYYKWLSRIRAIHRTAVVLKELFFFFYISSFFYLLYGMLFNPPITLTQVGSLIQGNGLKREYVSLSSMSPYIKLAVISSEDQFFTDHDGFDINEIKLAIKYNKKHPNRRYGASTISQQVAKNVFLWQGGGFFRKGIEVFFTFSLEKLWTKKTILERYFNIAEMGRGIFGVQAASKIYFNKNAKDLTRAEAAQIAASLPNPKRFTVKPLSNYIAHRYGDIMLQMSYLETDSDIQELIR